MSKLIFSEKAWEDYLFWQVQDKKVLTRINTLLKDISRHNFYGLGKPEPLKNYDGCWSRRIDDKHRLVYRISQDHIEILQCRGHYSD